MLLWRDGSIGSKRAEHPFNRCLTAACRSRSRQVSALQAGREKKRIRIPNEVRSVQSLFAAACLTSLIQRLAPARQAAVDLYEFGGGFARARFGAGPEDLYEEQESPREMLRRKQGYKVKTKKDLGELVNLRKAELAQQGGLQMTTALPYPCESSFVSSGRGAAHLLHLEELIDEVEAQAEASSEESVAHRWLTIKTCWDDLRFAGGG